MVTHARDSTHEPARAGTAACLAAQDACGLGRVFHLDHVGRQDLATRMRDAIDGTVHEDGVRTRDLGGQASTRDFADAIVSRVQRKS